MFRRILIANRGEVALRIARTARALDVTPIFAVSKADLQAPYLGLEGSEHIVIGPGTAAQSYLDPLRLVQAAVQTRASAIHPGWGFLSENPVFASLCASHGVTFIGPPAHVMALMGQKIPAKRRMASAGLRVIPGSEGILSDVEHARSVAESVGYPVLLKAESGGGGRGMRIAASAESLESAYREAEREALAAFSDGRLYLEKLITGGRHIEVQVMADRYGAAVHVGERDCSVQRKHQKLIEEAPSPALSDAARQEALAGAVAAVQAIGYVGAGTLEFLLDEAGLLYFMEMNTRLQVEHPVSEMCSGLDLVEHQLRVACGQPLAIAQQSLPLTGHAIECRINAEDPSDGFRPSPGVIERLTLPQGQGIRVDTHVAAGYEVPPLYDSLIAKIICHGADRDEARQRMVAALSATIIDGIKTTIPMHLKILQSDVFCSGQYDTSAIPGW